MSSNINEAKPTNKRNSTIDAIKGVLILLVIYGHTNSILTTNAIKDTFWFNNVFVTFQMPLFIAVSGYLFFYSVSKHSCQEVLLRKVKSILWPLVLWTVLYGLMGVAAHISEYHSVGSAIVAIIGCWNEYWFLWAVIASSLLMLLIKEIFGGKIGGIVANVIVCVALFFLPDDPFYISTMYPFFCLGYLVACKQLKFRNKVTIVLTFVLFGGLLAFSKWDYTFYVAKPFVKTWNINEISTYLYRMAVGITGCLVVILLIYWINKAFTNAKIMAGIRTCGRYSLELYITHVFVNVVIRAAFRYVTGIYGNPIAGNAYLYNLVILPVVTFAYTSVIVFGIKLVYKWRLTNRWIFGLK